MVIKRIGFIPRELVDYEEIPLHQRRFIEGFKDPENDVRIKAIKALGGKCVKCGYNEELVALEIDHINGDGTIERGKYSQRKIFSVIFNAYRLNITEAIEIIESRYQVLCANHHRIKTYYRKENQGDVFLQMINSESLKTLKNLLHIVKYALMKEKGLTI